MTRGISKLCILFVALGLVAVAASAAASGTGATESETRVPEPSGPVESPSARHGEIELPLPDREGDIGIHSPGCDAVSDCPYDIDITVSTAGTVYVKVGVDAAGKRKCTTLWLDPGGSVATLEVPHDPVSNMDTTGEC